MWTSFFRLMTELSSRKWVSRAAGKFANSAFSRRLIPRFARMYGIDPTEAELAMDQYPSLNAFFTRRLKPGLRPVDPDADTATSPVDGRISGIGTVKDGTLLNVKGQDYAVEALLNGSPRAVNYRNGFFIIIYLSPSDYHRIHSPVTGTIVEKEHVPGRVYPVNEFGMRHMKRTLSRNERVITYIRHDRGEAAVVKVGAMNVSSIRYADGLGSRIAKGDELAMFEFGSTVVLLFEQGTFRPRPDLMLNSKVRMGEAIGVLTEKNAGDAGR